MVNGPDAPPELRPDELLATLTRRGVQFLVVGGMGCRLHGAQHITQDLDLCPAWGQENFDRLAEALEELDARLRLSPELGDVEVRANGKLLRETSVTHWRTRAGDVDVLLSIPGERGRPVGFRELSPRAMQVTVGEAAIVVAALADIIRSKEHADRDKDRAALPELRALQARRASHPPPTPMAPHRQPGAAPLSSPAAPRPPDRYRPRHNPPTFGR